ncbi:MAG: hypothetical protein LWX23_12430 [Spirochaetia bacterium]|jgi:hypothetical protein|uniref:Leader peptide processing enzyme n=2 Tax=root TaxID=1 RepID=A0A652ZRW1_9SPIR|nr:hypothetical protein [Spirochaetia bacterium]MCE1210257.1 hypothetical protein [Spirochaetia bacterium]NLX45529.1 hypothetical protein [Treponema sp.]VBB38520.1 hypothetical protein TRIP_E100135 [uncultured Spirochaetota bacterium]HOI21813.1 hypothetical protein [Spirochaetales bacterium]
MTKGTKTLLFLLLATIGNIALTAVFFLLLLWIYSMSLARILPSSAVVWAMTFSFILAMAGTFFVYRKLLVVLRIKEYLEKKP